MLENELQVDENGTLFYARKSCWKTIYNNHNSRRNASLASCVISPQSTLKKKGGVELMEWE